MQFLPTADLLQQLHTSSDGLSNDEAQRRQRQWGPNEPVPAARHEWIRGLLSQVANPLVLILLFAAVLSAFLGETTSAVIIIGIVLTGSTINFVQSYRSSAALSRLRSSLVPTVTVLRDGTWQEVSRRELVPGDIIRLAAGDLVPADARLLTAKDLHVQQASLTGESLPAEKEAREPSEPVRSIADTPNAVFFGTSIVSGTATAVVERTGPATQFGDIALRLAARAPETEFDRGTRRFSFFIMQTVMFLTLAVFLVSIALKRDPLQTLLFVVALAVGLTPEFLPMIMAVTLSQGAAHMAKKQVVVKHLVAMQNFGSMDILCSDKTGTITSGVMTLSQSIDPLGQPSERPLSLAYINSFHETGIKSPLDVAILKHHPATNETDTKIDEIPFDFERRRLSIVVDHAGRRLLITKGAPEAVLSVCSQQEVTSGLQSLDKESHVRCRAVFEALSSQGYRVLAVAYRELPDKDAYQASDERDLILAGFVAFADPPVPETAEAIADLHADGVRVKILTGDNELVARQVCEQVGLNVSRVVLGEEVERMSDFALGHVAEEAAVFARVSPAQKNRIVIALKRRGHVVGYLGDGINDAPSLHAADVGISVAGAADVAQDAADIVLLERGLRVLHTGILEGRKAFGNVMKYLLMGTSSNFGNMFSMAGASFFLPFLPMLPVQVLLNNFLYDLAQITIPTDNVDATFIHKPRRWDIGLIRDFMLYVGPVSSLFDFVTFAALLWFFRGSEAHFHTGWFIESLATQTLVLLVIRTAGNPWDSKPSGPLLATILAVILIGIALPFSTVAADLGFTPMPLLFFFFVAGITAAYLFSVEIIKRRLTARLTA